MGRKRQYNRSMKPFLQNNDILFDIKFVKFELNLSNYATKPDLKKCNRC